ncbi:MAG TPA: Maf family protein [Flavitalea sp.]|nr:Maf family protein [Flavitalea sp.]
MAGIVLASQSPRRKQLLEWANIPFDVMVRETDESYPDGMPPQEVPVYIARNKAISVINSAEYQRYEQGRIVIAADTIVELNGEIIGKPIAKDQAIEILTKLSGQVHNVITGVVIRKMEEEIAFSDLTEVKFHDITLNDIIYYVEKYQPYDKAGAYAIQEWIGVIGIEWIRGDFYNVMGLPVSRVVKALAEW